MAALLNVTAASGQPQAATDTNIYKTFALTPTDEGTSRGGITHFMYWYDGYNYYREILRFRGLSDPLPEQLPASLDTNGNWGQPADGLQLSVRFHRREFLPGEPVNAMVLLRNVDTAPRGMYFRCYQKLQPSKNLSYVLRSGTNVSNWNWIAPPIPVEDRHPFDSRLMEPHSQMAFFVRPDLIFDLSKPGEYSIQVTRAEIPRSSWVHSTNVLDTAARHERARRFWAVTTNIVSGVATFRIVEKLSPSEIAATNAFARNVNETLRKGQHLQQQR